MAPTMTVTPRACLLQRASAATAISVAVLFSSGCGGKARAPLDGQPGTGGAGNASGGTGGRMSGAGGSGAVDPAGGEAGNPEGGSAGVSGGATGGSGGSAGSPPLSTGEVRLRLLTQAEYLASLQTLFGTVATPLDLPADTSVAGFVSIGASLVHVNQTAADKYEAASRAVVAEVFGDMARWQSLVGCQPQANLSDACVDTFVRSFGQRAYRRDLSDAEVMKWVQVARDAATLGGSAALGLSTAVSGLLQSLNFLYRIETNALDPANGRLKYDGRSMAIRLAFFLTGGPPSAELLAAGESGQLDTADGVRSAAASMLSDPALVGQLTSFFYEYTQAELVTVVEKSPTLFPDFNDSLRSSMREGTRLFLDKVVLAPGADVRSFFDSDQTFADAALAPLYGLTPPASGFAQFTLPPASGRAGIMGQAAILAGHSRPDYTSPTLRGLFMLQAFFCQTPEPPPSGVDTTPPVADPTLTTRQRLELLTAAPGCGDCHATFDPMGMALEHFDAIGRYRETENGRAIDASGTFEDGTTFNGARELGAALRGSATTTECLLRHFYRSVNGRTDDVYDQPVVDGMVASLGARGYVFRDLVADFVVSDAFRSAPALPITEANP
jgi:hypothetical protein